MLLISRKDNETKLVKQLIIESGFYNDEDLNLQKFLNMEAFLNDKSDISDNYYKFYQFLREISKTELNNFLFNLKNWFASKKRQTRVVRTMKNWLTKDLPEKIYENFLIIILDFVIKSAIRKYNINVILITLGNFLLSFLEEKVEEKESKKLGNILLNILIYTFEGKLNFNFFLQKNDEVLENLESYFSFNEIWFKSFKKVINLSNNNFYFFLNTSLPMLVPPRNWTITKNNSSIKYKNVLLYDASQITIGGLLLNNYFFRKSLQKLSKSWYKHKLFINTRTINVLNKIQKVSFVVNQEQLNLLIKYKTYLPEFLTKKQIRYLKKRKQQEIKKRKFFFKQKKRMTKKISKSRERVNFNIKASFEKIKKIDSKRTSYDFLTRIIRNFQELGSEKFYYSYELDFRMRVYPQQIELSPQGSKLSRSLIKFHEKFEFNLHEFSLYSTRLYKKEYVFSEDSLLQTFDLEVKPILDKFIRREKETVRYILLNANEPYLFLAACLEYKHYKEYLSRGEIYKTGFPIILDCSSSGLQIVSLFFLLNDFSKYLNLEPCEIRYDFYISIIKEFLEKNNEILVYLKKDVIGNMEFLRILRGICKKVIMTQFYEVSYQKVFKELYEGFFKNEKKLKLFLKKNIIYKEFEIFFCKSFWKYLRQLPLFNLRILFNKVISILKTNQLPLSWSVFNASKIVVDYRKTKKIKYDLKDNFLGRKQIIVKKSLSEKDFSKIRTSAMANFIYSLDAYINISVLSKYDSVIFSNHDSWGIGMGQASKLQKILREVYYDLAKDNIMLQNLIDEFCKLNLQNSEKISKGFIEYCKKNLKVGNYNPEDLLLCKFIIYYGS